MYMLCKPSQLSGISRAGNSEVANIAVGARSGKHCQQNNRNAASSPCSLSRVLEMAGGMFVRQCTAVDSLDCYPVFLDCSGVHLSVAAYLSTLDKLGLFGTRRCSQPSSRVSTRRLDWKILHRSSAALLLLQLRGCSVKGAHVKGAGGGCPGSSLRWSALPTTIAAWRHTRC